MKPMKGREVLTMTERVELLDFLDHEGDMPSWLYDLYAEDMIEAGVSEDRASEYLWERSDEIWDRFISSKRSVKKQTGDYDYDFEERGTTG